MFHPVCYICGILVESVSFLLQVGVVGGENSKVICNVKVFQLGEQSPLNAPGFISHCLSHYPVSGHQEENGTHGPPQHY